MNYAFYFRIVRTRRASLMFDPTAGVCVWGGGILFERISDFEILSRFKCFSPRHL